MLTPEHVAALTEVRRRMPRHTWLQLAARLTDSAFAIGPASIRQATADLLNPDAAWLLSEAFQSGAKASWSEIAAGMAAVDYLVGDNAGLTEIIWTGPPNGRFPVHRDGAHGVTRLPIP